MYWLGQFMGIVATFLCLIGSFWKKKWQMNVNTFAINLFFILNMVLIGEAASTAIIMCAVACVQTVIGTIHLFTGKKVTTFEKVLFIFLYAGCGIAGLVTSSAFVPEINLHNIIEMLPIIGAVINSISVFIRDEQTSRKFTLANASVFTVYYTILMSTAVFAEFAAVVTTCIALYKYRNSPKSVE